MRVNALSTFCDSDAIVSVSTMVGGGEGRGASGTPIDSAAVKVALAKELLFGAAIGKFTGEGAGVAGLTTDS
jgi:hypothetical protein